MFHRDLDHTGHSNSSAPLTPDILWKLDGGHVIWASPAVVDGYVYVASDDTQVYCLDALTGEQVWRYRTKNALGSPYLLLSRKRHEFLSWGPYPWITRSDLVAVASQADGKMSGPLEIAFLHHLIQMLFHVNGEIDISNNKSLNPDLKTLVDGILQYVNIYDPPEGDGNLL